MDKREAQLRNPAMGDLFSLPRMPDITMQTEGPGLPRGTIGYGMPFAGGNISAEGSYQPRPGETPEWGAMLRYKREF